MIDDNYRARINIDVEPELLERYNKLIWRGERSRIMRAVIAQLLDAIEREGMTVGILLAEGHLRIFGGDR